MDVAFDRATHRIKAQAWPLGAARSRLFLVLRHLGLRQEEIDSRIRSEREQIRLFELERSLRIRAEAARLLQENELRQAIEARKLARQIKQMEEFERMTDKQRKAWRMEQEIVGWISASQDS
jgi:hypothetical protein